MNSESSTVTIILMVIFSFIMGTMFSAFFFYDPDGAAWRAYQNERVYDECMNQISSSFVCRKLTED